MLLKPMGIGQLIDRGFQFYRTHFVKLMLLMLILFGPIYLLQSLLTTTDQTNTTSIFEQLREGSSYTEVLETIGDNTDAVNWVQTLVLIFVILPIFVLVIFPIAISSIVHMVRAFLSGEPIPETGELLRKSFRKLGKLVGSSVVVGLMYIGIYLVTALASLLFIVIGGMIVGIASTAGDGSAGAGLMIFLVLAGVALFFGFIFLNAYFLIRFCYFLPLIALGEQSMGIGRSWTITRKSFWRLFLMYMVIAIILYIISIVVALILAIFLSGIIYTLIQSIITIALMPLWLIPYVLSFFDLRARNEGSGLESLIQNTIQDSGFQTAEE
jgi:hypothetical protein